MEAQLTRARRPVIAPHFVGSHANKLDSKGRVSIPAHFRKFLEDHGEASILCCPALTGPLIECGGGDLIDMLIAAIAHLDQFSDARADFELYYTSHTQKLAIDADGRITLPGSFKSHLGTPARIAVVGLGGRFQLRDAAAFEAMIDRVKAHAEREAPVMAARSLPSTAGKTDLNNLLLPSDDEGPTQTRGGGRDPSIY